MILEFEVLRIIWWGLLVVFMLGLILYSCVELGVAMLLPVVKKSNLAPQHVYISSTGGRLLWGVQLLLLGVSLFYVWPLLFKVIDSSFPYLKWLMMSCLFGVPISLRVRRSFDSSFMQLCLDFTIAILALTLVVTLGNIMGQLFTGVPFEFDQQHNIVSRIALVDAFQQVPLLTSTLLLSVILLLGSVYQQKQFHDQSFVIYKKIVFLCGVCMLGLMSALAWNVADMYGYHVSSVINRLGMQPTSKQVKVMNGLWLDNFEHMPVLKILPITAVVSVLLSMLMMFFKQFQWAFKFIGAWVVVFIVSIYVIIYPFVLPSSVLYDHSLTVWDSSARQNILNQVLWVYVIAGLSVFLLASQLIDKFDKNQCLKRVVKINL